MCPARNSGLAPHLKCKTTAPALWKKKTKEKNPNPTVSCIFMGYLAWKDASFGIPFLPSYPLAPLARVHTYIHRAESRVRALLPRGYSCRGGGREGRPIIRGLTLRRPWDFEEIAGSRYCIMVRGQRRGECGDDNVRFDCGGVLYIRVFSCSLRVVIRDRGRVSWCSILDNINYTWNDWTFALESVNDCTRRCSFTDCPGMVISVTLRLTL